MSDWRVDKIPILSDNFVFVIHNGSLAAIVDPGDDSPVLKFLEERNLHCQFIFITHHHSDHISGVAEIKRKTGCLVYGPEANRRQLEGMVDQFVQMGAIVHLGDLIFEVLELPGHTLGHIAYWESHRKWLFSGDVVFSLGCGRLFEGTFEQMFHSLSIVKSLPDETLVYCTHDYYPANERFCRKYNYSLEGYNPVHPLVLSQEKEFNPFLVASDLLTFRDLRQKRNLL